MSQRMRDGWWSMNDRPCLILGYVKSEFASRWGRFFRRQGWEVHLAADAGEARRLTHSLVPTAVVLDVEMPDETGWLAAAKLTQEWPDVKVLLVGGRAPKRTTDIADVGAAAWLGRDDDPELALGKLMGRRLVNA
jgi:DNA-binding response OmpR family regulator